MIKKLSPFLVLIACCAFSQTVYAAEHRIGGGANYWYSIDDLKGDDYHFDDNGFGFVASYQYWGGLLGVEVDIELLPDHFDETAISPQAYILIGHGLYAGIGAGTTYADGDFTDEPFFALRGGFNIEVLPNIYADIYATYRFNDNTDIDDAVDDIDTDTLFLGAMLRLAL